MKTLQGPKKVGEIVQFIDQQAPGDTAEEWDNVGLLAGDAQSATSGVVVSIDLTFEAVELAVKNGYRLIVNHHPCIFPKSRGFSRFLAGTPLFEAVRQGISVVACHTNFDRCALTVVGGIAEALQIHPQGRLWEGDGSASLVKLVTFVPLADVEAVRSAVCAAGAGHIGNYDLTSFGVVGEGTFRGNDQAKPAVGQSGCLEKVQEVRLETVFPRGKQKSVLAALLKAHPYEEVAYDFYPIEQSPPTKSWISGMGYGFWGEFPEPRPFSDVAKDVKRLFNINGFWITEPVPSNVRRVGFVAGKGASFVRSASGLGCDLFITGEAGYHVALDGSCRGMAVMELGHRESEKFFVEALKKWLSGLGLAVIETQTPTQRIWLGGSR